MCFMKFPHFVLIRQKTLSPWMIRVSDWLIHFKVFFSEIAWPDGLIFELGISERSFMRFLHFALIGIHGGFLFLIG